MSYVGKMSPKSNVYGHFIMPSSSESKPRNLKAVCHHCIQTVAGSNKATSNFRRHLEKNHPDIYAKLDDPVADPKQLSVNKFTRNSTGTKWKSTDLRQMELTNCIVAFIVHDLLSLSLVESERFCILMATAEPIFTMPSRKHLSSVLLPQHSTTVQTRLKIQLQQVQNLCLTIDTRSFIGVTGHFILDHTINSVM
ncbi:Zinc finger BED domain-containing protein 1-like 3 [Homarus americanus]|uniref:Zinc finger BED domain-containing protein 1-like 3 n=1 Tax=Homarus americanus TaxID=6706 RepID=A0A8J5JGP1_HOMAM|nr:Zinc finger BED domain-containing protein 1-like 3 [Homarus americanus]